MSVRRITDKIQAAVEDKLNNFDKYLCLLSILINEERKNI